MSISARNRPGGLGEGKKKDERWSGYSHLPIYRARRGKRKMHGISGCTVNRETFNTHLMKNTVIGGRARYTVNSKSRNGKSEDDCS